MAQYNASLELKADGAQGYLDALGRGVAVVSAREIIQRLKRYAVAALKQVCVAVVKRNAQHGEYARGAAGGCTQPEDIVVAPLNVYVRMLHERVEKPRGLWTAVENIADNVQLIDGKALYNIRKRAYDLVRSAGGDYGIKYRVVVSDLI